MPDIVPIPQPPTHAYGFLGNLPDIDPSFALKSIRHLSELYGQVYQLDLLSRKVIVVSSYELAHEVCDDEHYEKTVAGPTKELRALSKDALFTAHNHEPVSCGYEPSAMCLPPFRILADRCLCNSTLWLTPLELVESAPHSHARLWGYGRAEDVPTTARYRVPIDPQMGQTRSESRN